MLVDITPEIYIGLPVPMQRRVTHPIERLELKDITSKLLPCFMITEDELFGRCREARLVDARMIIVYLALKTGKYSLKRIGQIFGRDHSTMIYYKTKVEDYMSIDKAYKARVEKAEGLLFTL